MCKHVVEKEDEQDDPRSQPPYKHCNAVQQVKHGVLLPGNIKIPSYVNKWCCDLREKNNKVVKLSLAAYKGLNDTEHRESMVKYVFWTT